MNSEAERQAAVLRALWEPAGEPGTALSDGLATYRGHAAATAGRALASAYPTVQALLGQEALAGLARQLWRHHPPRQGDLGTWGGSLPDWLAQLPEVQAWPYLPDCARLDWARHQAELAADIQSDPESLTCLGTQDPTQLVIDLRPELRLIRSDWPVVTLWTFHQLPQLKADTDAPPDHFAALRQALATHQAETAVVWRPHWRAEVAALPPGMVVWMEALLARPARPLSALLALASQEFDLSAWLEMALRQDWIWRVRVLSDRAD